MFEGTKFFLVEATKTNEDSSEKEHVILLCDEDVVPLAELPIELPAPYADLKNFIAPSVRRIHKELFAISFQHVGSSGAEITGDWNEQTVLDDSMTIIYLVDTNDKRKVMNTIKKTTSFTMNTVDKVLNFFGRLFRRR